MLATVPYGPPMPLRILTINLFNGRADCDSLVRALHEHVPDVVAAQELSENAAAVLADWGDNHLLDPRDDTTGMGVATNLPAHFTRLDFPNRRPVVAQLGGELFGFHNGVELISAHLVNPIERPVMVSHRVRQRELQALQATLTAPTKSARVLVGDLNSSPAWPMYRRLAALATDGAVAAGGARRSWGPTPTSPRLLRIDHAFLQGAQCVASRLVEVRGTDHRGLLVDLEPVR